MRIEDALRNAAQALAECTMQPTQYTPEMVRELLELEREIALTVEEAPEPLTAELHHRIDYVIEELDELAGAMLEAARHDPMNRAMLTSAADGLRARWGCGDYNRH
jgi:hypothetical protein